MEDTLICSTTNFCMYTCGFVLIDVEEKESG